MSRLPHAPGDTAGGRLGLIVLSVDETVERDFRRLFRPDGPAIYVTRVPSGADLTPETIAGMERALPEAAARLPAGAPLDAVGYACTSATAMFGAGRVAALVSGAAATACVTDPLTAALAAFARLGVCRIGLVSPYVASVAAPLAAAFAAAGHPVVADASFGEAVEAKVARIAPTSTLAAAVEIGRHPEVEAVFLSCTNLRTLEIVAAAEHALGKPVFGSNMALAWHLARLSASALAPDAPGRLMRLA